MKAARFFVLVAACSLSACFGDWDEPLGPASGGRIDSALVGQWRCREETKQVPSSFVLTIVPFDRHQYVLAVTDTKEAPFFLRAYATNVGEHDVMNMTMLSGEKEGWEYARFLIVEGRLRIQMLERNGLGDVADDVPSRVQAIDQLFDAPELWEEDGYTCGPVKDETAAKQPET